MGRPGTTFVDPDLERRFRSDGYVLVDLADAATLEEVRGVYERHPSGIGEGYYASIFSGDAGYKQAVHDEIGSRLWPLLERHLVAHELVVAAFMVKHAGDHTEVPPHQDWVTVDEDRAAAITCWVPLTSVGEAEGRMAVLPGSHRYLGGLRGSPTFPTPYESFHERVRAELMETVPVEVGQALVYDYRLLHGTPPNRSGSTRLVAYLSAVPAGEPLRHWYRNEDGTVEGYAVDAAFFRTFTLGDRPEGEPFARLDGYEPERLTFEELAARHERERRRRARARVLRPTRRRKVRRS